MEKFFKRLTITLLVSLGIICTFSSCGDDDDDTTKTPIYNEEQNQDEEEKDEHSTVNIQDIVKNNVSVIGYYQDFMFTFIIKSKVKSKLPNAKVEYGVGHLSTNSSNDEYYSCSVGDQAYYYSSYTNGDEETIIIKNPFWFYYVDKNPELMTYCSMYHQYYLSLIEKGLSNLSESQIDLYNKLEAKLDDAEKEPSIYYTPRIEILIDNKSYPVREFRIPYADNGTLSNPFTPLEAAGIGNSLAEGEKTDRSYYIKGKISRIKYTYSEEYGTAAFWISENGDEKDEFYAYGCYYLGNNPWKTYNNQIYKGDDVILYGKITNYKGIAEMATKENYMYSHNGRTYSSSGDKDTKPGDSGPETRTFTVGGVTFNMKLVEAGTFQMGSNEYSWEQPIHSVTITKDYYMGETEVTQALWKAVTGYSPTSGGSAWSSTYGLGDNYPAYYISYEDVQSFITKLNSLTGEKFRMPTEAEWEYAARGGNKSKGYTYSGSNTIGDVAWYTSNSSSTTHIVKTKAANELGIYDMSGNVYERCSDWYDGSYYSSSPQNDPTGPATDTGYRVIRGGGWDYNAAHCRCATRNGNAPSRRGNGVGFRLAL